MVQVMAASLGLQPQVVVLMLQLLGAEDALVQALLAVLGESVAEPKGLGFLMKIKTC